MDHVSIVSTACSTNSSMQLSLQAKSVDIETAALLLESGHRYSRVYSTSKISLSCGEHGIRCISGITQM